MKSLLMGLISLVSVRYADGIFGLPSFLEFGSCPPILPQKNLNFYKFSGPWYSQEVIPNEFVKSKSCIVDNYTWDGRTLTAQHSGLNSKNKLLNTVTRVVYDGISPKDRMALVSKDSRLPEAPFIVYATDYENIACVLSCVDKLGFRAALQFTLTRVPVVKRRKIQHCHKLAKKYGFTAFTKAVVQGEKCPYWSEVKSRNAQDNFQYEEVDNFFENLMQNTTFSGIEKISVCQVLLISVLFLNHFQFFI